jgi:hypothetical protein
VAVRKDRDQAKLEAFLRAKRSYEKKIADIDWLYEEFDKYVDAYKAGRARFNPKTKVFELLPGEQGDE